VKKASEYALEVAALLWDIGSFLFGKWENAICGAHYHVSPRQSIA
jgi:hypothetical protein